MSVLTGLGTYEMDKGFFGWRNEATVAACPEYWSPVGIHKAYIYPRPSISFNLVYLYLDGERHLTAPTDYIDIGDEEILRIIEYAAWLLAFKQGLKEAFANLDPYKQLFLLAAGKRNARLRSTAQYRQYMGEHRDEATPKSEATPQQGVRG
jgi:hypothetical protein